MKPERAGTLLELLVALGIAAVLAGTGFAGFQAAHRFSAHAAAVQFDAVLAYARAQAETSGNGATLVFLRSSSGTVVRVHTGRPTARGAVRQSALPEQSLPAAISEGSLGPPPFALFLDSAGLASGAASYPPLEGGHPVFPILPSEPVCPAAGAYALVLAAGGAQERRPIPCRLPFPAGASWLRPL